MHFVRHVPKMIGWARPPSFPLPGDPHMTGFLGQKFDFTGDDGGWYALIADMGISINMRVTSPVADVPEITYITGTHTS